MLSKHASLLLLPLVLAASAPAQNTAPAQNAAPAAAPAAAAPKAEPAGSAAPAPAAAPVSKPFYKEWTMDDLLPALADLGKNRSYQNGGRVFNQAACGACHSFGRFWQGSGLAPDLTPVASKFTRDAILESILDPSATINGQYYNTLYKLKDGTVISGVLREVKDGKARIAVAVAAPEATVDIPESDIVSEQPSPVSGMPPGMLNSFTLEQILDLFAFLEAAGEPDASIYTK